MVNDDGKSGFTVGRMLFTSEKIVSDDTGSVLRFPEHPYIIKMFEETSRKVNIIFI